ncbi:MAG: hypothetical protein KDC98_24910 [Planctomycetes bacterium]|nr:hypothetical protein [Planctomycetota bacterium]
MLFRTVFREILDRLEGIDHRLAALEATIATMANAGRQREETLRDQLEAKSSELEAMGEQGLHVVEQLDSALRRIRELEAGGR